MGGALQTPTHCRATGRGHHRSAQSCRLAPTGGQRRDRGAPPEGFWRLVDTHSRHGGDGRAVVRIPLWGLIWILFNSMFLFWQPVDLVRFRQFPWPDSRLWTRLGHSGLGRDHHGLSSQSSLACGLGSAPQTSVVHKVSRPEAQEPLRNSGSRVRGTHV